MLNEDRLWADLLSSMPLCFNLFGGLAGEDAAPHAARAVHAWWPDAPRGHTQLVLEHSPGRRDDAFLGNRTSFDAMFQIDVDASSRAVVAVETKYHEHAKAPTTRAAKASARHLEVSERSGAFRDGWASRLVGTELHQIWLDHLLLLSMLQHPSHLWTWGRFVLAYPARNPSFARAAAAYRDVLRDPSTFEARPLDDLVDTPNALDAPTVAALRDRYLLRGDLSRWSRDSRANTAGVITRGRPRHSPTPVGPRRASVR